MKRIIVPISVILTVDENDTPKEMLEYVQDNLDSLNGCVRKGGEFSLCGISDISVNDLVDCD